MRTATLRATLALAFAAFAVWGAYTATVAAHNAAFGHSHTLRAHGSAQACAEQAEGC